MNKSHRRFPPQASFTTRLERLWLGFCVGSLACSPAAKIPPPHDLTSPAPAEGAEHARRSNDELDGEIARQPLARETRGPVALSESEASALAIDHLAQNVANGTLPDSFVLPPRCTHSCVSMDRSKGVRLCRNWSCYFFVFRSSRPPPCRWLCGACGRIPPLGHFLGSKRVWRRSMDVPSSFRETKQWRGFRPPSLSWTSSGTRMMASSSGSI